MKIKVSEASGQVLNLMVAKCENPEWFDNLPEGMSVVNLCMDYSSLSAPSTDWAQGGPIIEREKIATLCDEDEDWSARSYLNCGGIYFGPTLLIAAMRCFVSSKLGDEVEVSDELI